jgi:hypothetical protein
MSLRFIWSRTPVPRAPKCQCDKRYPPNVPFTRRRRVPTMRVMKTYILTRERGRACSLHVMGEKFRQPILITSDQYPAWPMLTVAVTLLLDYFDGEEQAEFKAQLMAGALVRFLNRLGEEWALTEAQLNEAVMTILVSGKAAIVNAANDVCIEYLVGHRRDTLRLDAARPLHGVSDAAKRGT